MILRIQIGDHVRFRSGKAPEAMKGRERDIGVVVALVTETGPEPWPVVQFDDYRSAALQPGMVEVVGIVDWTYEDPEIAN